jgi:hypothetical protein
LRGLAGVDHDDPAPRPAEDQRRAQPSGAASDDRHVMRVRLHAPSLRIGEAADKGALPFPGTAR